MSKGSEAVKTWRRRFRIRIVKAMGGKCVCCGYNRCDKALDVHHIDPDGKDFSFGERRAHPTAFSGLEPELRKCALVCRNCHVEIHAGVCAWPMTSSFDCDVFAAQVSEEQPRSKGRFTENNATVF